MANQDASCTIMISSQMLTTATSTPVVPVYSDTFCTMMQASQLLATASVAAPPSGMVFTLTSVTATVSYPH